jgi:CHASE2 domain-containing sensor protein
MSDRSPESQTKSWWHALWLIIPSALLTALAWHAFHSVPIAYVALSTTWLFALVAVAAANGP